MRHIRRILHPTDFSPNSREALKHTLHLAERFDADLQVLHVIEPIPLSEAAREELTVSERRARFWNKVKPLTQCRRRGNRLRLQSRPSC